MQQRPKLFENVWNWIWIKHIFPKKFVVPSIEIVHDRAVAEVQRGCIRGCRFCQAGFIYRPVREKNQLI